MGRKKKEPAPPETADYVYDDNLSVRVKTRAESEKASLDHYFGSLLREQDLIDGIHRYCSLCLPLHVMKRYNSSTSTGNLRNHLRDKHGINLENKVTDKNQRKVTDMLLTVGKENSVVAGSVTDSRFLLARQICLWFCRDLLPFNTISKEGIHDFMVYAGVIKKNDSLPDRTTIADTALNDIFFALKAFIKKFVQTSLPDTITVSMDFWTDNVKRVSYINYWIHWMNGDFIMQKLCLGIKRFPHPHKFEDITRAFNQIMDEYQLMNKKFLAVTDSGGNIKKACSELNLEREPCLCHNLHLLVATDLIEKHSKLKPIRDLISHIKIIKKSLIYRYEELKKINDEEYNKQLLHLVSSLENISDILECTEVLITEFDDEDIQVLVDFCNDQTRRSTNFTTVKNCNATRWNSILTMLHSIIKNIDNINNCLGSMRRYDLILSVEELNLAVDFVKVLEPFKKASDLMQGYTYPSLNVAVCCYVDIKAALNELLACKTNSSIIKTSAAFLLDRLDERFPITENMIVAAFLDPSMQNLPIISAYCRAQDVEMSQLLIKKWIEYKPELKKQQSAKVQAPKKPSAVAKLRMELIQKHIGNAHVSEDSFETKIQQEYLKYSVIGDIVEDPLIWWKTHEAAFPYLSALARIMLSIPSSSGATEHHFSEAGYFINKKKANLDPLTAEMVMFIHDNFDHISSNQ